LSLILLLVKRYLMTEKGNLPKDTRKVNYYIKYSGIGLQMFAIVGLGCYAGIKLNAYLGFEKHYVTIVISLLSIVTAMVFAYRQVLKK